MANKDKNKSATPGPAPAPDTETDSTERRRILSAIILERLQKQDVVWIRIADPDVHRVDDLQIATKARIDAYLIRWSEWADTLTLEDLTSKESDSDSLMKQLADGWLKLKNDYRLPVSVHLLTNDQPSAKRIKDAKKNDCHLAKFLAHEWKINRRDNDDWINIWDELHTASGLDEDQFSEFVDACKFDCSYARPELDEDADEYQAYYWVEHIYDSLFEHEDHSTLPIELNHAELLQLLGWRSEQSRQILKLPKGDVSAIAGLTSAMHGGESLGGELAGDTTLNAFSTSSRSLDSESPDAEPLQTKSLDPQSFNSESLDAESSSSQSSGWSDSNIQASAATEEEMLERRSEDFQANDENHEDEIESNPEGDFSAENSDQHNESQKNTDFPFTPNPSDSKPQPSLSYLRGASAAWLQAASDSDSETADWLKAGATPAGTTASGGTFFGGPAANNFKNNAEAEFSESAESSGVTGDPAPSGLAASLAAKKQSREKPSWKDLAEKERQTSGPRKFGDPVESKTDSADTQRITGRLRQMMSTIKTEAPDVDAEIDGEHVDGYAEDVDGFDGQVDGRDEESSNSNDEVRDYVHNGDYETGVQTVHISKERGFIDDFGSSESDSTTIGIAAFGTDDSEQPEESSAASKKTKKARKPKRRQSEILSEVEQRELELDPSPGASAETRSYSEEERSAYDNDDQHANQTDTFSKISRLARRQEGTEVGDLEASLNAFNWYINNGDELFQESRFEDAEKEYIRALELLGTLDVPTTDEEFKVLQNLGDIYLFLDQPDKAVELYECTKEDRFNSRIPASKYIAALIKLGAVYEEKSCFNDAERQYRKAVEVAAENLAKDDPILVRLNQACLDLARNRSTLMSRFSSTEVDRIRVLAKQEAEVAIMHRKRKTTEAEIMQPEMWKGGSRPQTEEIVAAPASPNQRWMMLSGAIVIIFIFAFAMFVPQATVPGGNSTAATESAGIYSSADGLKVIDLANGGKAQYSFGGTSKQASYSFVGDEINDLLPFIPGHMRTAFLFFNSKDSAIVDSNGTYLYESTAPEHELVKRMWKYAELAQGYRQEKNFYPESDNAWMISKDKLTFQNPITRAEDQAIIFSATGESTDTPVRKSIADGELWKGQPAASPGRIICYVYNSRMFFIRGYDRNGKVLTSSDPTKSFYIECSDGLDITKEDLKAPVIDSTTTPVLKSDKKLRFIFAASPETEARFNLLLSAIPGGLFCLSLVSLAVWRYRVNKKVAGPFSVGAFALSTALLLVWFVIGILQV